jgi:hypothetical protein
VAGDHGARGRFVLQSRSRDAIARVSTLLGGAATQATLAALSLLGAALLLAAARRLAR